MKKVAVLLVEDEYDFGFILKQYLEMYDFNVHWYQNPTQALDDFTIVNQCDIAILDVMLPEMDGFTLAKKLQEKTDFPFLFLTAKNQQIDRILGLKLGADDYISKPCDPEELILRIKNILNRKGYKSVNDEILIGNYIFKPKQLILQHSDTDCQLTEREVSLLLLLTQYNNQVVTRESILQHVWKNTDYFTGRSMDVFISRLRKYFQHDDRIKIQSIRGVGFHVVFPVD